jgi:hypothetical protein
LEEQRAQFDPKNSDKMCLDEEDGVAIHERDAEFDPKLR